MFKRLLTESFGKYKTVYLKSKQHEKNLKKSQVIRQVLETKTLRKIFDAYCGYIQNFKKSKTFMFIILGRLDTLEKKKTFRTWIENGNVKVMHKLNKQIIENIHVIDTKNKVIGLKESENQSILKEVETFQFSLKAKARKLMANYL
jgi:hypothetical protein